MGYWDFFVGLFMVVLPFVMQALLPCLSSSLCVSPLSTFATWTSQRPKSVTIAASKLLRYGFLWYIFLFLVSSLMIDMSSNFLCEWNCLWVLNFQSKCLTLRILFNIASCCCFFLEGLPWSIWANFHVEWNCFWGQNFPWKFRTPGNCQSKPKMTTSN